MLKNIPQIISPNLMKTLMEMGHGDEVIFSDGNFPAVTCAKRLIRNDGLLIPDLLEAVIPYFPLDKSVDHPVIVMALSPGEKAPEIWETYRSLIKKHESSFADFEYVERFTFYERAESAFAIVVTSDQSFKGNIILKKGVIRG